MSTHSFVSDLWKSTIMAVEGGKGLPGIPQIATGNKRHGEFIDIALRKMHDRIADEAVPDDFMDLLAEIDRKLADKKVGE